MATKIALIYDWFDTPVGGAERILKVLHESYPSAPWFTSHMLAKEVPWAVGWDVRTTWLQRLPMWFRSHRLLMLPLLPLAFESIDLRGYDVVISITSAFAKGVVTRAETRHICYLLTPPRWLYEGPVTRLPLLSWIERVVRRLLVRWDSISSSRVDEYISISNEVATRCEQHYHRKSAVIRPPLEAELWEDLAHRVAQREMDPTHHPGAPLVHDGYLLVVSRLVPYKRVDLAVDAFTQYHKHSLNIRLVIVGSGSMKDTLHRQVRSLGVSDSVLWLSSLSDADLAWLYRHSRAVLMPQREDWGYVAAEAVACGATIVSFDQGGQIEVLKSYPRAILVPDQDPRSFAQALEKIDHLGYNAKIHENSHLRGRGRDAFVAAITEKVSQAVREGYR